jgi:hypothetical protein
MVVSAEMAIGALTGMVVGALPHQKSTWTGGAPWRAATRAFAVQDAAVPVPTVAALAGIGTRSAARAAVKNAAGRVGMRDRALIEAGPPDPL